MRVINRTEIVIILLLIGGSFISKGYQIPEVMANQTSDYNIRENKPYVLLVPTKIKANPIIINKNFVLHKLTFVSLFLPQDFRLYKRKKDSFLYVNKTKNVQITILEQKNNLVPSEFKDLYKNNFDFFKTVMYATDDELLSYKASLIPYAGLDMKIYEFQIGANKGFLYTGFNNNKSRYIYEVFFDNIIVTVNILVEKNVDHRVKDSFEYIICSIRRK